MSDKKGEKKKDETTDDKKKDADKKHVDAGDKDAKKKSVDSGDKDDKKVEEAKKDADDKDKENDKAAGADAGGAKKAANGPRPLHPFSKVVVHPLVLLNATDHFHRMSGADTGRRVVGILLGEVYKGKVDVTNSYAVPFEEDAKDSSIWFLDHNYHEEMFAMFKKVSARERIVGWYSSGPKIRPSDIDINELVRRYTAHPVFCIIDVNPRDDSEIPTEAYTAIDTVKDTKDGTGRTFVHLPVEIGAYEAEEVGVEHLLRNIREKVGGTLTDSVTARLNSLRGLRNRMEEIVAYLDQVVAGKMPVNHQIMYNLQNIFNLMPDLKSDDMAKSFATKTNDNMLVIYMSSMVRSILALHNLINNKLENKQLEKQKHEPPASGGDKDASKEKAAGEKGEAETADKDKSKEKDATKEKK